jgi:hypothetical protein
VQAAVKPAVTSVEWEDDPYSIDLSNQFHAALHRPETEALVERIPVPFSEGGAYTPNDGEARAAEHLIKTLCDAPLDRQMLVLPTVVAPARRVLRALTGAVPLAGRRVVAVSGDAISINNIYRDGDILWNVRAVPVPLVFFTHQNPVDWDEPDGRGSADAAPRAPSFRLDPPNGTDDVLLHAELVRRVAEAVFHREPSPRLVDDADTFAKRLRELTPAFFGPSGDRKGGRGEYIICVRPQILEAGVASQIKAEAKLEVWTRQALVGGFPGRDAHSPRPVLPARASQWARIKTLVIDHAHGPEH